MKSFLEYMFYKIYVYQSTKGHKNDPFFFSLGSLAFATSLYLINLYGLLLLLGIEFKFPKGKIVPVSIMLIVIIYYYFTLYHDKKYEIIVNKFKAETEKQREKGNRIATWFLAIPLISMVLILTLFVLKNNGVFGSIN